MVVSRSRVTLACDHTLSLYPCNLFSGDKQAGKHWQKKKKGLIVSVTPAGAAALLSGQATRQTRRRFEFLPSLPLVLSRRHGSYKVVLWDKFISTF